MDFDFILANSNAFIAAAWLTLKLSFFWYYFFYNYRLFLYFNELF